MVRNRKGFSLLELMIIVSILGVLARIAIPTMLKYTKRAKTTEAVINVRKMFDSSVSYFHTEHIDPDGNVLISQFPISALTRPTCCVGPTKAVVDDWDEIDTWVALNFGPSDPLYFSYQYDSSGVETASQFTVAAFGDLDDDGIASTFVRFGTITNWEVRGSPGMNIANELE